MYSTKVDGRKEMNVAIAVADLSGITNHLLQPQVDFCEDSYD